MRFTKCEQEIMEVFWEVERPLSQAELIEASPNRSWKARSVYILLNGLLDKGAIKEAGFIRSGKTFARQFVPSFTQEELLVNSFAVSKRRLSVPKLMSALLGQEEVTREEIQQLLTMIAEKEKTLDK